MRSISVDDVDTRAYIDGFNDGYEACMNYVKEHRWHNLSENENDLPEDTSPVLAKDSDNNFFTCYYSGLRNTWQIYNPFMFLDWEYIDDFDAGIFVVEWKYIG